MLFLSLFPNFFHINTTILYVLMFITIIPTAFIFLRFYRFGGQ